MGNSGQDDPQGWDEIEFRRGTVQTGSEARKAQTGRDPKRRMGDFESAGEGRPLPGHPVYVLVCADRPAHPAEQRSPYEVGRLFAKQWETTLRKLDPTQKASCRTEIGCDDGPRYAPILSCVT